jgi:hypothetical protein
MAGEARTQAFVLASATVMIGEMAAIYDLNPTANSIGLVKNFQCSASPTYVDLTQGVKGSIVDSVMTNNQVKASMEVYEYTSANLAYGLGLDGTMLTTTGVGYPTTAALIGSTAMPVFEITFSSPTDVSGQFVIGEWLMIQDPLFPDHAHYGKITAAGTGVANTSPSTGYTISVPIQGQGLKDGNNFPTGSTVQLVNAIDVGSKDNQPYLSAKVTAVLPNNSPLTILFPKIRVIKGFSLTFSTDKFTDLPYEFQPYDVLPGDPLYADFVNRGSARLLSTN